MANPSGNITRKINRLGEVLEQKKLLEIEERELKDALIAAHVRERTTQHFKCTIFTQERGYLDKALVLEALGLAKTAECTKVTTSTVVKVTPIVQDEQVAA